MAHQTPEATPRKFMVSVVLGGTAGIVAKTIVAPLERLRILRQVQGTEGTLWDAARGVLRSEGWTGFWTGNSANVARTAPARGSAEIKDSLRPRFQ